MHSQAGSGEPHGGSEQPGSNPANQAALAALDRLLTVLGRLRAPDGCPWDRVQTVQSLAPYLLEEAFEAVDAIQQNRTHDAALELGDLLMNVLMIPMAGETEGTMAVSEVADGIAAKLIRRHPHVFGDREAASVDEVWKNWEAIKKEERRERGEDDSAIAGIPVSLPALLRALRVIEKSKRAGFRYADITGPLAKVEEEFAELKAEVARGDKARMENEFGDLLLSLVSLASDLSIHPELALRGAIERYATRFRRMEADLGTAMKDLEPSQWIAAWGRTKKALEAKAPENSR